MAYVKNNWVDREGTTRYFETVDSDGAKIFTPDYTQVTELGTPVNADNMNHIEEGIAAGSFTKYDSMATYAKNDLVTTIVDNELKVYKSLQDNNTNALDNASFWEEVEFSGGGGGLEIGDIGFTQMAIDETKGLRRKLNGQLIIQEQYVQFTNIIKNSVALNTDLACTESEWQTAVTMSANGVCYKFVIDDNAGTIRLPKYPTYFIAGLAGNAPVAGNGMTLGLSNPTTGNTGFRLLNSYFTGSNPTYGQPAGTRDTGNTGITEGYSFGITTDSSKSGIEAQLSNNQTEQIRGTYFIQVATGAETEDNIINEIELNNPFSLLDYKFSEYELNNLSWLRSQGQYNSKAIYPVVYELLLKIYNGTETKAGVSVKLSTEAFTDYDFVLNTAEETFRLPIITKNRVLIAKKEATNQDTTWYNLYSDGWCEQGGQTSGYTTIQLLKSFSNTLYYVNFISLDNANTSQYENYMVSDKTTSSFTIGQKRTGLDGGVCNWVACGYAGIPTENNYLYFYVGETVQNANLINAGRIEEKLGDKLDRSAVKAYIIETYKNGASWYRVWSDGWIEQGGFYSGSIAANKNVYIELPNAFSTMNYNVQITCSLDTITPGSAYMALCSYIDSPNGFYIVNDANPSDMNGAYWKACGY